MTIRVVDGTDPYYYLDAQFFFDTVSNGARTGTAVGNNVQFDLYQRDETLPGLGYAPLVSLNSLNAPGIVIEAKVIILTAFNNLTDFKLGRGGTSAQFEAFGTNALLQPTVVGVKDMGLALNNANVVLTSNIVPKLRMTYSTAPTQGEGRVIFKLAS